LRIVSNKSVNWINEQQKQRQVIEHDQIEFITQDEPNDDAENIELIKKALNELPAKSKTILSMFYVDSYSVQEIADVLSLSEGTVKSRLFYARKMLKEKFVTFKK